MVLTRRRPEHKRQNDLRYLHDTIVCFGDALDDLRALAATIPWPRTLRTRLRRGLELTREPDLLVAAARIPDAAGESPSTEELRDVLAAGLSRVFDV